MKLTCNWTSGREAYDSKPCRHDFGGDENYTRSDGIHVEVIL